jgi:hypothetical protein
MVVGALGLLALPLDAAAQAPAPAVRLTVDARALAGESWRASGSVLPAEAVQIRVSRDGRLLQTRTVVPDASGRFTLRLRGRSPGSYRVVAMHGATAALPYARSPRQRVIVHAPRAGAGSSGFVVRKLQARLRAAGYVVGRRGAFDARTARAVLAFRKLSGMPRTTFASAAVFRRLKAGGGRFRVRHPGHGRHVEASLSRQVLALIGAGGRVERIYPISSGSPFTPTITGRFAVYRKDFGTNILGMIHASYFRGGYAIHGYKSVPIYPASHGCLRVPPDDALSVFNWIRYGTRVDVYP